MLELADVKKTGPIYDLGSGDGRILITAASKYGCRAVGYELDHELVNLSRDRAKAKGVERMVSIEQKDLFAEGDKVFVRSVISATYLGGLPGIPAPAGGRPIQGIETWSVYRLKDGLAPKLVKDAKEGLGGRGKFIWLSDHWKDYYDVVPVTAGIATLERVEILSGLKGTERVALEDPSKKKVEKDDDN